MNIFQGYYKTIILDVDGVIFDSNLIKAECIYSAASRHTDEKTADRFLQFFTGLNGVPREKKISEFFPGNPELAESILNTYNDSLKYSLSRMQLTEGALEFIGKFYNGCKLIALSGGSEIEIKALFQKHNIEKHFENILGGPSTKEENLSKLSLDYPVLYIGDSKVDYEVSRKISSDFIFLYGYTQFDGWEAYFTGNKILKKVKNFGELLI